MVSSAILTVGLHESRHFASVYRFIGRGRWLVDMVFRAVALVMGHLEIPLVADDRLKKHRGKKICGAGSQNDGSTPGDKGRKGYGLCFVIIGLAVRLNGIADPVYCLPYAARLWWPPRAKVKPATMEYKENTKLAAELIELSRSLMEGDPLIRVVTDLGYTCETVINGRPAGYGDDGENKQALGIARASPGIDPPRPRKTSQEGPGHAESLGPV